MQIETGKPISEKLATALRSNLTGEDVRDVAESKGYAKATAETILSRSALVNPRSRGLVLALTRRAIKNAQKDHKTLTSVKK